MKKTSSYLSTLLLLCFAALSSCKKEKEIITTRNKADEFKLVTQKQNHLNQLSLDVVNITINKISSTFGSAMRVGKAYRTLDCGDVTIDSTVFPYRFEIVFGAGCTGPNGLPMTGNITGFYNNEDFENAGDFFEITSANLIFDTFSISGTARIEITDDLSANHKRGSVITNLTTNYSFSQLELNGQNNFTFEYSDNPSVGDGNISFDGSGFGTTNGGLSYTQTITETLEMHTGDLCNYSYFLKGKLLIQTAGLSDREIDYGNGDCDNIAHVTVDGVRDRIFLTD